MTRSVGVVVALTLALLSAGCSRGGDDAPASGASPVPSAASPSTSSAPSTTALAPGADPFAIPDVIDAAYVNRVLEALYAIDGDITREVLATRGVSFDPVKRLRAIYGEPQLKYELQGLATVLAGDPSRFRSPPGNRTAVTILLVTAKPTCILAEVDMSLEEVVITPPTIGADEQYIVALAPRAGLSEINPTPWLIVGAEIVSRDEVSAEKAPCG